tara:strand:+ start:970 stop:2313 length:1344 start_codon:yes stop_codon:yes gene_type:complete
LEKKYFGTDGIRGRVGQSSMTPTFVMQLGWAIGQILSQQNKKKVLIGKDTRSSGCLLETAIQAGLSAAGIDTYTAGVMPTPVVAYLTRTMHFDAGIMLSASHNAYVDNGIKIFSEYGYKLTDADEVAIEQMLEKNLTVVDAQALGQSFVMENVTEHYIKFCKKIIPKNICFKDLKVVLDCANGAAFMLAPTIFTALGMHVISINNQPDGININTQCGSTCPTMLQEAVKKNNADLGIAFDGDADRVIMVDENGDIVDGDELLFIIAYHQTLNKKLQGGVVGTQMTNLGMEHAFAKYNIPFTRSKVGDRYVLEKLHTNNWQLGGEASGHILHLAFGTTGDGIVSALLVLWALKATQMSLATYKKQMKKYPQCMINVPISTQINSQQQTKIDAAVRQVEDSLANTGRVLLRPSGTEPLLRVMVESQCMDVTNKLTRELAETVQSIVSKV